MNIRSPRPISDSFLALQDEYLSEEVLEKGITDSSLRGCFIPCHSCVDNIIYSVGGIQLRLAGLSTSTGFIYTGRRFEENFSDFIKKYGFRDMYSSGFYPFESLEEHWAYWSRYIFINRYRDRDNGTYKKLFKLVNDKDYFVLTTNVDHQFQKAGFDKHRLFVYSRGGNHTLTFCTW